MLARMSTPYPFVQFRYRLSEIQIVHGGKEVYLVPPSTSTSMTVPASIWIDCHTRVVIIMQRAPHHNMRAALRGGDLG